MVGPNPEGRRIDEHFQVPQEKVVLEDPTGKHDRIEVVLAAECGCRIEQAVRDSSLECACTFARIASARTILNQIY